MSNEDTVTLFDRFQVVGSYPALYDPVADAVVISDLHLGLEALMAKSGTYMPKTQLETVREDLQGIVDAVEPDTLIVCGDIKHAFSKSSYGEREEVQAFIDFVSDLVSDILLVKGNHDNYLRSYVNKYDNVELAEFFVEEGVCYLHGHKTTETLETFEADYIVMGHEHPALALQDNVGITEKIDCFLYGPMHDDRNIIVLPAFSTLADGSPMNRVDSGHDLLSPILKNQVDMDALQAIGVDKDAGVFRFPKLAKI